MNTLIHVLSEEETVRITEIEHAFEDKLITREERDAMLRELLGNDAQRELVPA